MPSADLMVWFLTGNDDKFREVRSILFPFGITLRRLKRSKTEIQNPRLQGIARFALNEAMQGRDCPTLVEDSGLFIEALAGFPGPYSSFVYDTIGLKGILHLMGGHRNRRAYFQTTVAFGSGRGKVRLFTGKVRGTISRRILGTSGFGYDPIFVPEGYGRTFGQSSDSFKNSLSHRSRAFHKFARWFTSNSDSPHLRTGKIALK